MKLIKPSYEILTQQPGFDGMLKHIELCGRTAYQSSDKISNDSAPKFVEMLKSKHHGSVLEHGTVYLMIDEDLLEPSGIEFFYSNNNYSFITGYNPDISSSSVRKSRDITYYITTNYRVLVENDRLDDLKYQCEPTEFHKKRISVKLIIDRSILAEFTRHRAFSHIAESTRYCNYSNDKFGNELTFIIPPWLNLEEERYWTNIECRVESDTHFFDAEDDLDLNVWLRQLIDAEESYLLLTNDKTEYANPHKKWSPQQARSILPNSLKTELIMTGFVDDWRQFFKLRCDKSAHPQAQEIAIPLRDEFIKLRYINEEA